MWLEAGHWVDDTLGARIDEGLRASAHLPFRCWSRTRPYTGSVGDVASVARRLAGGLAARGIGPGDAVAFQFPNWMEAAASFWACSLLGVTLVPVVHIYGPKELQYVLRNTRARALLTADRFGERDYCETLPTFLRELEALETVVVAGGGAPTGCLGWQEALGDPLEKAEAVDPDAASVIGFTSGTTADPKGVVHSHRTLLYEASQARTIRPAKPTHAGLIASPVSHITGMLSLLSPVANRGPINLLDRWETSHVLRIMLEGDLSCGGGASFFLTSLLDSPELTDAHLERMRHIALGGSPIAPQLVERAHERGIAVIRAYGSTEHPSTTAGSFSDPFEKRLYTEGRPLEAVEVQIRDDDGRVLPAGEPGEIHSRGPDLFVGYTDETLNAAAFDAEGWYATGDIGVCDAEGYLKIVDRKKDIIIRGGENISAVEVEALLEQAPGVEEAAVVAAPDPRLGERVCAFVRVSDGAEAPDLEQLRQHLGRAGLARQKWPEELRVVPDLPRTASGKLQKSRLRQLARKPNH